MMLPFYSPPYLYQLPRYSFSTLEGGYSQNNLNGSISVPKVKSNSFSSSRDSEWLTLEICREFTRAACPRGEYSCKYAHPSSNVNCNNGRVVCCYDYIKGRCNRFQPPCKYLHPPNHLKDQLLKNGRTNLLLKNIHFNTASVDKRCPNISRANSTGSYQGSHIPVTSQEYVQPDNIENPIINNMQPLTFMPQLPYYFMSTQDNITSEILSENQSLQHKSENQMNYVMTVDPNMNSSLPIQQYFYGNNYGLGNQILIKSWPLCTYSAVPY